MLKRDLRQKLNETRSISYSFGTQYLKVRSNRKIYCLKQTFNKSHMKSGPSNMVLVRGVY